MKISLNWLKDYIDLPESTEDIAHMLTMSGLEVEGIENVEAIKGGLKGIVIGEVLECSKHPNADTLSTTLVDIGEGQTLPIVCGAPNVAKGQKVVVATVGTILYSEDGQEFKIKKAKIRGEVSEGMICAEDELGFGKNHDGIIVLEDKISNGTPAAEYFKLESDEALEIGLTPNRADATSHIGVARDLRALLKRDVRYPVISNFKPDNNDNSIEVLVENRNACPRYSGITISDLTISESPEWIKRRLLSIGQTPINNVVDITNFVLHEMGQPLHAFDLDKIAGKKIVVKTLPEGTTFKTLDEQDRKLKAKDLMICDAEEGMCIAGVFGGAKSGVTNQTTSIFLESACFAPDYIRSTSLTHGLKTDSAFRFERGTDPNITVYALKRAALLIKEYAGGQISSDVIDIYPEKILHFEVQMHYAHIKRLIGKEIEQARIKEILNLLDIEIKNETPNSFIAVVPPYRVDVTREADVIEEILRIYGYDNIELSKSTGSPFHAEFAHPDLRKEQLIASEMLAANGYFEIITNSLTKPEYAERSNALQEKNSVFILNKLSEDLAVMRQTLLFSGLEVIAHNINRRQYDLKLFELGKEYKFIEKKYKEQFYLSIWVTGNYEAENWIKEKRPLEFHDLYGIVLKIINKFIGERYSSENFKDERFAYGLKLSINGFEFAKFGLLNKSTTQIVGVNEDIFYAELDFEWLVDKRKDDFKIQGISKFPEVRRDLSLVIDKSVPFEKIKKITEANEFLGILKQVNVFDYYVGEKLENDKKAIAINLTLQDNYKTLTDKVIDKTMKKLINLFETEIGAIIRK